MNNNDWVRANDSGRSLADEMAPDVVNLVDEIIDQWLNEHTTLQGPKKRAYRMAVRRAALSKLSLQMSREAERFDDA